MVNSPSSEPAPPDSAVLLQLPQNEIHLWRANASDWQHLALWLSNSLAENEKKRAARFHFDRDRIVYTVSRGLLRHILARIYMRESPEKLVFENGIAGKPYLTYPINQHPLHFNIAHSDTAILIAIARHEVGVDVEKIRTDFSWQEIAGNVFTGTEQQELMQLPANQRPHGFFTGWTRKEAYIKAKGGGLSIPLRTFSVSLDKTHPRILNIQSEPDESNNWFLANIDCPEDFSATVAARIPSGKCRFFEVLHKTAPAELSFRET